MKNIAFVSIGKESHYCANLLIKSIKKFNKIDKIIQISNQEDDKLQNVDFKISYEFKKSTFMINRLESQIKTIEKFGPTIFLDSDMLVNCNLNDLEDKLSKNDLIFTKRRKNFYINDKFNNIYYPEFTNKTAYEVMPFNGGFLAANNLLAIKELLVIYKSLPDRFKYWYGDQVAQNKIFNLQKYKILVLDNKYNFNVKNINQFDKNICIFHFKGRFKVLIKPFFEKYLKEKNSNN